MWMDETQLDAGNKRGQNVRMSTSLCGTHMREPLHGLVPSVFVNPNHPHGLKRLGESAHISLLAQGGGPLVELVGKPQIHCTKSKEESQTDGSQIFA